MFIQDTMFCLYHKINQPLEWVSGVMSSTWKQEKKEMKLALIKLVFFRE